MDSAEKRVADEFHAFQSDRDPAHAFRAFDIVTEFQRDLTAADHPLREQALALYQQFLQALNNCLDHEWDAKSEPSPRIPRPFPGSPPTTSGLIDPSEIRDPELRARYQKEVQEAADARRDYAIQHQLHSLDERAIDWFKDFVERCYSDSPRRRNELLTAVSGRPRQ